MAAGGKGTCERVGQEKRIQMQNSAPSFHKYAAGGVMRDWV